MPGTSKSSIAPDPKPNNVFYVWYTELCRRLNSSPAAVVKPAKTKCNTVLDFAADRLKFEEWSPVITALKQDTSLHVISIRSKIGSYQFLHEIDTEDKARRMTRKYGSLWTHYVLNSLINSLSYTIARNQVLTCIELDGLPMFTQYLESLLKALRKNSTVRYFSLANCPIQDSGCRAVCSYLQIMPNVEVLNLSRCDLTSESGLYIAKLINYQQLSRYSTSWHNSLRYEEPDAGTICGIKRILLNCNPYIGNEGLSYILKELEDDLWIKAIDMQKCGITEEIAPRLLDILQYNRSLEIADFRQNDLTTDTIDKVLGILKEKQSIDYQPQYQWCNTALSLECVSVGTSHSQYTFRTNNMYGSKCVPLHYGISNNIPRSSKSDHILKKSNEKLKSTNSKPTLTLTNKHISGLSTRLQEEIKKRKETEKRNVELKRKLSRVRQPQVKKVQESKSATVKTLIEAIEKLKPPPNYVPMIKASSDKKLSETLPQTQDNTKDETTAVFHQSRVKKKNGYTKHQNGFKTVQNGYVNHVKHTNGYSIGNSTDPCNIFEKLLRKCDSYENDSEQEELMKYFAKSPENGKVEIAKLNGVSKLNGSVQMNGVSKVSCKINGVTKVKELFNGTTKVSECMNGTRKKKSGKSHKYDNDLNESPDSQASLINYMEELKNDRDVSNNQKKCH